MGKGRRYDQEYKDMIVELFKSGMSLAELSSANMALQNQQLTAGLKM
jgi:lambda repressor-like predicted transcriptional regulator